MYSKDKALTIYLIAGEPSGDLLGAHLMRSLRAQYPHPIRFYGIGGERMEAEGLSSLFPYHDLSMMGLLEIVPHIYRTLIHINSTIDDITSKQPDMVITIDSPGFCFSVVKKLREAGLKSKFVHYVAPTVWAYKPERAQKCAKLFDHMLLLLPFEPPYFEKVGLPCSFVGHPVICETEVGSGAEFRAKHGIAADTPLFCLLAGSRKGEVKRHMPVFARTIAMLASTYPNLALVFAAPDHVLPVLAPFLNSCPFPVFIAEDEQDKKNAIAASNFAIVKSGTVAFEVAMAGVPMLVTYRMNRFSVWWLRRMIKTKYVNLMNIIMNREIIPELLQEQCRPMLLASCASTLLALPEIRRRQLANVKTAIHKLMPASGKKPSDEAARVIISLLQAKS